MQKWQYLELYIGSRSVISSNGQHGELKQMDILDERGTKTGGTWLSCAQVLNNLGSEGWELAINRSGTLILKRPAPVDA
jgi:hypothetical protein